MTNKTPLDLFFELSELHKDKIKVKHSSNEDGKFQSIVFSLSESKAEFSKSGDDYALTLNHQKQIINKDVFDAISESLKKNGKLI